MKLKLAHKLIGSALAMVAVIASAGLVSLSFLRSVGEEGVRVGAMLAPLGDAAMEIKLEATEAHLLFEEIMSGDAGESIKEVWEHIDNAEWYANAILKGGANDEGVFIATDDPQVRSKVELVVKDIRDFREAARDRHASLEFVTDESTGAGAGSQSDILFDEIFDKFIKNADEAEELIHAQMKQGIADLHEIEETAKRDLVTIVVAATFLSLFMGLGFARSISRPVNAVATQATRIANGDLSAANDALVDLERGDELGELGRAFVQMRKNLGELLGNVQQSVTELSSRSSQVGSTAKQYSASAAEQASSVAEVSTTIEEIKQTSEAADLSAQEVMRSAEEAVETGGRGLDAVAEAIAATEAVSARVDGIAEKILHLSEQNAQIREIVDTVNDLAEQSNLLAVNASIEAAKAGEQGRGFAVVASEVRSLAEQSKRSAQQIRSILAEIQKATESAVMATEEGTKRAADGRTRIESLRTVIDELAAVLESNADRARQIAGSSRQQSSGIAQIASAVQNVDAAAHESAAGVRQLEEATLGLNELAGMMKGIVARYQA